jgi:hypothetical protein
MASMPERYSLLGLDLRVDFTLPGLAPALPHGYPEVEVRLVSATRLEEGLSEVSAPGRWRGLLGDGEAFEIERGWDGDLVFAYGSRARFHLSADGRTLSCCPVEVADLGWRRALVTKVLPNVAIANGYEALHAAAVAGEGGAILVLAASGGGKSSLALELVRRGHRFFADDVVVLGRRDGRVEAHPAGPFVNLPPRGAPGASPTYSLLDAGPLKHWVAIDGAATEPCPVRALALLARGRTGVLGAWSMGASPLPLAPFMLGLPDDDGRDAERFALYSDLVESTRLIRLTGGAGNGPGDLAETLLRMPALLGPTAFEVAS